MSKQWITHFGTKSLNLLGGLISLSYVLLQLIERLQYKRTLMDGGVVVNH